MIIRFSKGVAYIARGAGHGGFIEGKVGDPLAFFAGGLAGEEHVATGVRAKAHAHGLGDHDVSRLTVGCKVEERSPTVAIAGDVVSIWT